MLRTVLMFVQVFASVAIVLLVLIQRGKGSDAGAGFGAGASGTVFGARGARTGLSRATAILAAVFMVNSLALSFVGSRSVSVPKSILDEVQTQQVPAPLEAPAVLPAPSQAQPETPVPAPAN